MNRITTTFSILAAVAALMIAGSAKAAVILQSSFNNGGEALAPTGDGSGNYSYDFSSLGSFAAAGTGKLVLGYTSRNSPTVEGGAAPTSITYGGAALSEVGQDGGARGRTGIWYLDNVTTDGDLVINFGTDGATTDVGFSLFALNGLVAGTATSGGSLSTGASPTVNLGSAGGFALSTAARNNQSLTGDSNYTLDYNYSNGSNRLLSQHLVTSSGGDVTASVGNTSSESITAYGWDASAVPEPASASLALLGLGGLLITRRRHTA